MSDTAWFTPPAPKGQERDSTIPRFYLRPVQNNFRSNQEGRPIFDELEYVEILIPGNRGTTVDERVKPEHIERWPQAYHAFKQGREMAQDGTPLEEWAAVSRAQVEELKHFHIRTVEALANLDDTGLGKAVPMGGYALREKARRALDLAKGAAPADALAAENDALKGTIAVLQEQNAVLAAEVERLKSTPLKRVEE